MKPGIWLFIFILSGTIPLASEVWSQSGSELNEANQLYNQNRFEEAARVYNKKIQDGFINGHLHYNLGNTYFRMGDLPRAILNYAKAQNLLPRHEDVKANLKYALRLTENAWDGRIRHPLESIFFWIPELSLQEHWTVVLWINLGFWIALAFRLHYPTQTSLTVRNIFLGMLVLTLFSSGFHWHQESHQAIGVVQPPQTDVHSGWNTGSTVMLQLPRGTLVSISSEKEGWYQVELPDEKKGWVLKSEIAN